MDGTDDITISIHALLAESDDLAQTVSGAYSLFLSTLSLRRATIQWEGMKSLSEVISIHALLAESDFAVGR